MKTARSKEKLQRRPKKEKNKRKHRLVAESEFCSCDEHVSKKPKLSDIERGPTRTTGKANTKRKRGKRNATNKVALKKPRIKDRLKKIPQVKQNKRKQHLTEETVSDITDNDDNDDNDSDSDLSRRSSENSKSAAKLTKKCNHSEEDLSTSELELSTEEEVIGSDISTTDLDEKPKGSKNPKSKNKKSRLPQRCQKPRQKKLQNKAAKKCKCPQSTKKQVAKNKQQKSKKKHPLDLKSLSSSGLDPFKVRSLRQRLLSDLRKTLQRRSQQPHLFNVKNIYPEILCQQWIEENNSDNEVNDFETILTMIENMDIDEPRRFHSSYSDENDSDDD